MQKTVELWVAMNEDGDYIATTDESSALEDLAGDCGGYAARVVKVLVTMSPPTIESASVSIPDDAGTFAELPGDADDAAEQRAQSQ